MSENSVPEAEKTAVTGPSVAAGLGFPLSRDETSPDATGWRIPANSTGETVKI